MKEITDQIEGIDGAVVAYRLFKGGSAGRVIVLLHGLASNMTRWMEFAEQTSLKDSWDILLPDLRGHGASKYRSLINMEKWCGDIAAILDKEGYTSAVIGGHCLGANIAVNFAYLYPGRCKGLILLEPLFSESFTGTLKKLSERKWLVGIVINIIRLINISGIYRRKFPPLDLRELDKTGREMIELAGTPEILRERYGSPLHDLRYLPAAAYFQSVRELLRPLPPVNEIETPKLFIFSSGRLFSESVNAEEQCNSYRNCETVVIDSYHWVPTEKPEELRCAIEEWCCRHFS